MHKLVILIKPSQAWSALEESWPEFIHLVEDMPGLRREASSRVERLLYGKDEYVKVHELFFDTLAEAEQAMSSPQGRAAGKLLQQMTGGAMTLFFAEHLEDDLPHIQPITPQDHETGPV